MNIKVLVATHKQYQMPNEDIYLPIHVGREGKEDLGYQGDNTGDNISSKNANFCELTGLYWAWKNMSYVDYVGLVHYRRYFEIDKKIINNEQIENIMKNSDIILPIKRNYVIDTIWSHYGRSHNIEDLEKIKKIIIEKYPEYVSSFNHVMNSKKLHLYNMFIMKYEHFDEYMEWLFSIMEVLEESIDISNYDQYQSRIFGFLSERLFNVWLHKKDLNSTELRVRNLEGDNKLNKYVNFLKRRFLVRIN